MLNRRQSKFGQSLVLIYIDLLLSCGLLETPVECISQCHAVGCCHCRVFWKAGRHTQSIHLYKKIFYNPFQVSRVSEIFTKAQGKTTSFIHELFYMM